MTTLPRLLEDAARSSADPEPVRLVFERLIEEDPSYFLDRVDEPLASAIARVSAASRSLARLILSEPGAIEALSTPVSQPDPHASQHAPHASPTDVLGSPDAAELVRRKRLAYLRIASEDLGGAKDLEHVGGDLSRLADDVLEAACRIAGATDLAVIGMGKHGAEELNYASDVDVVFVAPAGADLAETSTAARRVLSIAGQSYRIDTDLRPEGRDGALVRTLESYEAYWEKWARPWEFQALLKARASAGARELGDDFEAAAGSAVWSQRFDADALAELRSMKSRVEELISRRGLSDRELKRGRGGIRDIEFSAQLLQLVHGRDDPSLRVPATLSALEVLAGAGYVDAADATVLALAYRFLRTVEHRLQLVEEAQVHTVPPPGPARDHLARVLGFGSGEGLARRRSERLDGVLARYQSSVRSIHERLFFRPLLEVFGAPGSSRRLSEAAASERLAAFGFREAERTHQALAELTRGLTRSSRLMQQLLPVLLGWLSESPDPDSGLLGLRNLAGVPHQRDVVVAAFRDSPELARRLCLVLGTSRSLGDLVQHHPALALRIGDDAELQPSEPRELAERAVAATEGSADQAMRGLRRVVGEETLRIASGELLGITAPLSVPRQLAALGDAALAAALRSVSPGLPFGVVAMGRLGGNELAYGSDLDVLLVYEGAGSADAAEAERVATSMFRLLNGTTPADRIWTVDAQLRPEGKHGPLARSFEAYVEYHDRWIAAWERQSLLRARPLAGDPELLNRFMALAQRTLWDRPLSLEDVRQIRRLKARMERERIPAGEDPQFHFKLGRGSLADVEWTVQLLQLSHDVSATGTAQALRMLTASGALTEREGAILAAALDFLNTTRDRWHLVGNYVAGAGGVVSRVGSDSLPQSPEALSRLARSLGERPVELREQYRRVTRRARKVVERRFYGL
ncbi:MAG: bifunctional [glutamine synthetase] adenylyltransferase/[glutamine synthetase]-adenylyl-L-tyrosine phosphorylase [Acidimicrobiales bacterium]